jgi:YD repeat-containing protein
LTFLVNRTAMTKTIASTVAFTHVYEYDDANRLTKMDGVTYTWDANGNLRNDGVFTFTYDAANRLITATNGTTLTLGYRHNGDGVLVAQTVDGVETTFVQDVGGSLPQILVETSGGSTKRLLYGVAGVLAWAEGDAWVYPLKDALGSVRQLTDEDRQIDDEATYSPFGVPDDGDAGALHGSTGERWYGGVGLVYLRARWLDPFTG